MLVSQFQVQLISVDRFSLKDFHIPPSFTGYSVVRYSMSVQKAITVFGAHGTGRFSYWKAQSGFSTESGL